MLKGSPPDPAAWKRRTTLFLASQILSLFGSLLVQYALFWHVTLVTRSGWMMTAYIISGFLPTFLVAPFAGVWADRADRKTLIMLSDGLIALATLALALLFMAGHGALWLVMAAAAVRALGQAVQGPAVGAFLPQFVPKDQLTRVNGISTFLQSAMTLASPILAAALLSVWPLERVFFLDVGTAVLAIALLWFFLEVPPHERAGGPQAVTYFADLALGFRYIREHRFLVPFFVFVGILLFLMAPAAFLTPLQVARSFGGEYWRLTAIEVVFSAGMTAGGALVATRGTFGNRVHTMVAATLVMGVCTVLLGLMSNFWVYLAPMLAFGVAMPFYNTAATVLLQEHVQPDYLGRVFGVFTMLATSAMPMGMLAFGPLAEAVRIEWLLVGTGLLMLAQVGWVLLDRSLIEAGVPRA